jgi:hypothetical protein
MSDDWRVRAELHDGGAAHQLVESIDAGKLESDVEAKFHDRVVVSHDGNEVFAYAGTREDAEAAKREIQAFATAKGWQLECDLKHWHPSEEAWEDAEVPLPRNDAEKASEHAALIEMERREAEERGWPEFEVRIDCPSHHDAVTFADRLRSEKLLPVHRFRYVLVGALDEDEATALAERLRQEAPPGSKVTVEGSWKAAWGDQPPNRFAVLGGLGV